LDLQSTGSEERKRARALDVAGRVLSGRAWSYNPFWEDIYQSWVVVFAPECTLAEAIEELLATTEDVVAAFARGERTPAALGFPALCVEDLVAAYGLSDHWKADLADLALRLDTITISPEQAAAIASQTIPRLRERLADERRKSE